MALLILGAAGLLVLVVYACLVIARDADRREEALWARWEQEHGEE